MDGLECLDRIMVERPCPVVMVSSLTAEGADATLEALRLGAVDFVPKPEGAVSLRIDEFAPTLVEKIRAAATAKMKNERAAEGAGAAPHASAREPRRSPRKPCGVARRADRAKASCSSAPRRAVRRRSKPCSLRCPQTFPWPILVAQHMPASFTGPLARRLDGSVRIRVVEVLRPMVLEPGCVYIGRGDADIIVPSAARGLVAMSAPARPTIPGIRAPTGS